MDFLGQSLVRMLLLLRKPLLAKLVRHFHIRPGLLELTACDLHARLEKTLREMSELTGNVGYEIKEGIAGLSRNELEHAGWRVEATVEDSLTAVLLPRLLNLEKLDIETGATPPSEFWVGRVVRRAGLREAAFGDAGVLAKLRSFLWAHEHGQTGGTLTEVGFVLPGLQNMFFHRIGTEAGDGSDERLARVQPRSSACTHLELKDCRFHDAALLRMVAIPRALKPFIYELGCGSIAKCRISFLAIRNALDMHKETLENIWITYPHSGIKFYRDADPSSGMKSLSHFPGLKRLRIAPDFIFGYELTATHAKEGDVRGRREDFEERKERGWGMDGEFEWAPCSSATNAAPPYNEVVYEEGTWTEKKTGWCCDEWTTLLNVYGKRKDREEGEHEGEEMDDVEDEDGYDTEERGETGSPNTERSV
ncbi:hypothetical protein BU26DRAFT_608518 [Trematosphaeria pertusa]|uniref:Uncharacterized protein n=1 Tax=Trematosphaeria pertusa TaxID=390896 RepID=A0A6A6I177_9PLEO|nr:uncharacterized protein BU26DRAFT_608518 [Trematosphaeria pertusa]KAF2244026.1 hypothetical protein BU26DRAFT_608518 [Trematosphaeria pertusa]